MSEGVGDWPQDSAKRLILGELAAFALDKLEEEGLAVEGAAVVVETDDGAVWWFGTGGPTYTRGLLANGIDVLKRKPREEEEAE